MYLYFIHILYFSEAELCFWFYNFMFDVSLLHLIAFTNLLSNVKSFVFLGIQGFVLPSITCYTKAL